VGCELRNITANQAELIKQLEQSARTEMRLRAKALAYAKDR